jgi:hypothetical protein
MFFKRSLERRRSYLLYCRTKDQIVDILTKALSKASFEELISKLSVCSN